MTVPYIEDLDLGQHNRALEETKTSLHHNVSLSEDLFLFFSFSHSLRGHTLRCYCGLLYPWLRKRESSAKVDCLASSRDEAGIICRV